MYLNLEIAMIIFSSLIILVCIFYGVITTNETDKSNAFTMAICFNFFVIALSIIIFFQLSNMNSYHIIESVETTILNNKSKTRTVFCNGFIVNTEKPIGQAGDTLFIKR